MSDRLPAVTPARVLVAAGDALTLELLAKAVSRPGVEPLLASDGIEAVGPAREGRLDLLIVDEGLSIVDGVAVCARVRGFRLSRQPAIVVANVATPEGVERALQAGADDVIRKPLQEALVRHRVEALLAQRSAAARLALLEGTIDAAMSGITLLVARAPEYPALLVNRTFASMTGYAKEELVGQSLRMLAGPETDVLTLQAMRDALDEGRECRAVIQNYRKDGSTFWNELSLAPLRDADGRLTHFVGIQTDASLRVRVGELALAQQELEEQNAQRSRELAEALQSLERRRRFADTVLDAITAGVVTTDRSGRVSFANHAAQELLRLSRADCVGKPVLELFGPDPSLQAALDATAEREARGIQCELRSPGGARFVAGLTLVHASGAAGDELGHVLLFRELLPEVQPGAGRAAGHVPAGPRAVAPLALLQDALTQAARQGEARHPVVENPFQAMPQVSVDPAPAIEALRLLLESGHALVVPPGRLRVRVRHGISADAAARDVRLDLAPDGPAAEQALRTPWPPSVEPKLERARQLLASQAGRLEVARDEDGRFVLSAFLPRASRDPGAE